MAVSGSQENRTVGALDLLVVIKDLAPANISKETEKLGLDLNWDIDVL
jgi:hypothetical protein